MEALCHVSVWTCLSMETRACTYLCYPYVLYTLYLYFINVQAYILYWINISLALAL